MSIDFFKNATNAGLFFLSPQFEKTVFKISNPPLFTVSKTYFLKFNFDFMTELDQ